MRTHCFAQGTPPSALWWTQREGNPKREGRYIHTYIADSLRCAAETNNIVKQLNSNTNKKRKQNHQCSAVAVSSSAWWRTSSLWRLCIVFLPDATEPLCSQRKCQASWKKRPMDVHICSPCPPGYWVLSQWAMSPGVYLCLLMSIYHKYLHSSCPF